MTISPTPCSRPAIDPARKGSVLVLPILGAAALRARVVLALLHLFGLAVVLAVVGAIAILVALFRRFGRRGDLSRSGWSG